MHLCEATLTHSVFLSLPYQKENKTFEIYILIYAPDLYCFAISKFYQKENKTFEIYILIFAKIWIWQNNTNLEHK